ncbi:MAG: TVP38/TMEM64 family protein [Sedimentibacter sp.]
MGKIKKNLKNNLKIVLLVVVLVVIFLSPLKKYLFQLDLPEYFKTFTDNPFAPIIFIGFYIASVLLVLPGLPMTILAGALFGFKLGSIVTVVGSNIGIQLTFMISHYFGKALMPFLSKRFPYLGVMDKKIKNNGLRVMITMRLIPIIPFNAINYLAGLTSLPYKDFAFGSLVGMLPGSLLYVYFGSSAIEVKDNPAGLILSVVLLILFTIISIAVKKRTASDD